MVTALLREISLQAAATASPRIEMIGFAMTDSAHGADRGCEWFRLRLRLKGPLSLRPKLPTVSVIVLAMGLTGCARNPYRRDVNPGQPEARAKPVRTASRLASHPHVHSEARQNVELRVRRPDPLLLVSSSTGAQLRVQASRYQGGGPG